MVKFFFITILVLYSIKSISQSNQEKYWYYRKRLTDYFVKIGHNPGESVKSRRTNTLCNSITKTN